MGEEEKIFSDVQRNVIYNEMLKPIKIKISQILLYDTEAAMKFLQRYNDIIKLTNEQDILSKISELEWDIGLYQKNDGLQKSFEYKSQSIIQQIKDMQVDGDRLSLEDLEKEFNRLKQTYKTTCQKYSFQARDTIEQQLYDLYGRVMVRRVREGDLDEIEIPKEDVAGLTIFMNNEIGKLSQNTNPQVQNAIERIKFKLMDEENAFQGDEIWKLLNYAQNQKFIGLNQLPRQLNQPQITALAVVNKKKGLVSRIKKVFQKEPQLPLQVEDLSKITLDWLAQHIPEDMLRKIEERRLKEEGRNPESKYLPDSKTAIYDFLSNPPEIERFEYEYEDEIGNKQKIVFSRWSNQISLIPISLDKENRKRLTRTIYTDEGNPSQEMLRYAMFLDDILGTNFANDLARDYGEFIQNSKTTYISKYSAKSKLFKNLLKSYIRIAKVYVKTETKFRGNEEANRRAFYEKSRFREEIKQNADTSRVYVTKRGKIQIKNKTEDRKTK